jgi:hypothetical protein
VEELGYVDGQNATITARYAGGESMLCRRWRQISLP